MHFSRVTLFMRQHASTVAVHNSTPLLGRSHPARLPMFVVAASRSGSTTSTDSAASVVWGLDPTAPRVHIIHGQPMTLSNIVPLQLQDLHPDLLTTSVFVEFLAKNLVSRSAAKQAVAAVVLSACYLPSQLDTMADLAAKQSLDTTFFVSKDSGLHAVFSKQAQDIVGGNSLPLQEAAEQSEPGSPADAQHASGAAQALLEPVMGLLQPLSLARLQVARAAEQSLRTQLRLFDAATWNAVIQQRLMSKKSVLARECLAVRSLMGPPARAAAKQMIAKHSLYWLELEQDQMQALGGTSSSRNSKRRTRRSTANGSSGTSAETQEDEPSQPAVIVISKLPMLVEEASQLPQEAFTDYQVTLASGAATGPASSSSTGDSSRGLATFRWPFGM